MNVGDLGVETVGLTPAATSARRRLDVIGGCVCPTPRSTWLGCGFGAEDFLGAVLSTAAQPIWVVDAEGVIRFANPAAIATLGYDCANDLLGCHSHETIHHSHPDGTQYPAAERPMLLPRVTGDTVSSDLDWFSGAIGKSLAASRTS
jgi:PAS domain-containing protein